VSERGVVPVRVRAFGALRPILAGGIAAGVLDLGAALAQGALRGAGPTRVLQAIASGALGRAAYDGGLASALVGLLSHFTVATGAATVFVLMARRVPWLLRAPWVSGPVFGIGVWAAMRFVVLPLSAFPHVQPSDPEAIATALLIHVLFVGLPIAFAVRASAGRPTFHSTPGDHA
jgi:hypothetical protein